MSKNDHSPPSLLTSLLYLAGAVLVLLVLGVGVLLSFTTVSHPAAATLPGGVNIDIVSRWGFGAAENPDQTRVTIAGRELVFRKTSLTADGIPINGYDGAAKKVSLVEDGGRLRLIADDHEIMID